MLGGFLRSRGRFNTQSASRSIRFPATFHSLIVPFDQFAAPSQDRAAFLFGLAMKQPNKLAQSLPKPKPAAPMPIVNKLAPKPAQKPKGKC